MTRLGTMTLSAALVLAALTPTAFAQTPVAVAPYTLSIFAPPPNGLSETDSVTILDGHVFVGYGDNHLPDGSDGLDSQVVEFTMAGEVVHIYTVPGHNDGLKPDPVTHLLWALQNEDANPNLVIIDTRTQQQQHFTFGPTPHGGGYDDITFLHCNAFLSASNPAHNPNTGPGIVRATLGRGIVNVTPVLSATANAIDLVSGATIGLNLQDPDSMTRDLLGNIVLDSQADQELIIVSHPGQPDQSALRLPLSIRNGNTITPVEVDDTAFVTSSQGFILFADKTLNNVYKLEKSAFAPGTAYTAADGASAVGSLDLTDGIITPIVTGLGNPGGLIFVSDAEAHAQPNPLEQIENLEQCLALPPLR
jgi:hypothetical protein